VKTRSIVRSAYGRELQTDRADVQTDVDAHEVSKPLIWRCRLWLWEPAQLEFPYGDPATNPGAGEAIGLKHAKTDCKEESGQFGFRGAVQGFDSGFLAEENGFRVRIITTLCRVDRFGSGNRVIGLVWRRVGARGTRRMAVLRAAGLSFSGQIVSNAGLASSGNSPWGGS
jgi:hypothetical protein